jgi:hypothetical protein
MSTCRDRPCTVVHVTARQARDASTYFSVAPDHVLSCIESEGILCYMFRLVYGIPTLYSGKFFFAPKISQFFLGITQTPTSKWCGLTLQHRYGHQATTLERCSYVFRRRCRVLLWAWLCSAKRMKDSAGQQVQPPGSARSRSPHQGVA